MKNPIKQFPRKTVTILFAIPRIASKQGVAILLALTVGLLFNTITHGQQLQQRPPTTNTPSPIIIKLDPAKGSAFNNGIFEGWGTSLCWWANRVGYNNKLVDESVDAFFDPNKGLMLNIVRYNIGGGDDPKHHHITRSDSNMPGFAQPVLDKDGNFEVDGNGLVMYTYDWTKDDNQMNVLRKILARNKNTLVEAFSNSPPYFMTVSGCSSGGTGRDKDNLDPRYNDMFADFLADVVYHFRKVWKIELNSIEPMNEPSSGYWGAYSNKQEGCDFKNNEKKDAIFQSLDKALRRKGVRDGILIAGFDESIIEQLISTWNGVKPETQKVIDRLNNHTYGGSRRNDARKLAESTGKHFWMSEVDGKDSIGGNDAGDMGSALWLAKRVTDDMNGLQASAWVIWQVIDSHHSDFDTKERNGFTLKGGYWGLGYADHFTNKIVLGKRYYAWGQYTRYIRPGDRYVYSTGKTLAAYNKESGKITVVVYNDTAKAQEYVFDLSSFEKIPSNTVRIIRTSGELNQGENWTEIPSIPITGKQFKATVKPFSITTYVIPGTGASGILPKN